VVSIFPLFNYFFGEIVTMFRKRIPEFANYKTKNYTKVIDILDIRNKKEN